MTRKVSISIRSANLKSTGLGESDEGTIKEEILIMTKTDIFKIPVEAKVLAGEAYEEANREAQAIMGKSIQNSRVREKLNSSLQ